MNFLARIAGRILSRHGHRNERERIRAKARQMNIDMGREIPRALR